MKHIKINKNNKNKQIKNKRYKKHKKINNTISIPIVDLTKDHKEHKEHKDHKESIPKRVRELVWTTHNGETFKHKCFVSWCDNNINVFNFQVGHDIPESKGGTLDIDNLKPICGNCNLSMSNKYTITEWSKIVKKQEEHEIQDIHVIQ